MFISYKDQPPVLTNASTHLLANNNNILYDTICFIIKFKKNSHCNTSFKWPLYVESISSDPMQKMVSSPTTGNTDNRGGATFSTSQTIFDGEKMIATS